MFKRNAAVLIVAGLVLGGGAVALAGGSPARPTLVAAAQEGTPPTTGPAQAPADRQARREALRACLQQAGEDRAARRACAEAAGLRPGPGRHHPGRGPGGAGGPFGPLPLGRAVHGTVVVPDGEDGWHEVTFDRGAVGEATDGSKIVLDRPDGQTVTIALTADTKYHGIADAAGIVDGRPAMVVSEDGKALHVVQKDPEHRRGPGNNQAPGGVPTD